jgi:16S rRNA (cytidine1402-2'-O)-methyltransferase
LTPEGRLVLVATPIGNLGDLSPRAVAALREADVVCCEDTRRTRALLTAAGVPGAGRLVSLHGHNEVARLPQVLGWVGEGRTVAVVTDAGTPAVSDPGARLVIAAAEQGLTVTVVPGPSSVLAALVVSGLPTERFCVEGFLPRKGGDRRRRVEALAAEERTTVLLEAPGRLAGTLGDLAAACGDRPVAVVRELTKLHEEVWRGRLPEAADEFAARPVRGEVVVVLGGASPPEPPSADRVAAAVGERMDAGDSARQAAETVSVALGVPRRQAYELAITLRADPSTGRSGRPAGDRPGGPRGAPGPAAG